MVRSDESGQGPGDRHLYDFHLPLVKDVVDMKNREDPGISPTPPEKGKKVETLKGFGQEIRGRTFSPFVEIAQQDFGPPRRRVG
jgi:hypothetical protein